MYEFSNDEKDTPTSVDIHPITNDLGVGYTSGAVRFINLITGAILSEHKYVHVLLIIKSLSIKLIVQPVSLLSLPITCISMYMYIS